jgi:F-type H+-transporting ATPase subunit b
MNEITDVFGVDWRLLFIQAINFGLLLMLLWHFLYRPVVRMIERRQEKIAQGVHDAERAKRELEEVEEKRKEILTRTSEEAEQTLRAAVSRAQTCEHEILEEAQKKSEEMLADTKAKAEELKRQILAESEKEIARMIVLGAEKVLRKQ